MNQLEDELEHLTVQINRMEEMLVELRKRRDSILERLNARG